MSAKYTPGPWQAEPMTGRGAWVAGANSEWSALACGDTDLRAEANARLIAAAPELLDALIDAIDSTDMDHLRERWRAVVAKATAA